MTQAGESWTLKIKAFELKIASFFDYLLEEKLSWEFMKIVAELRQQKQHLVENEHLTSLFWKFKAAKKKNFMNSQFHKGCEGQPVKN